MKKVINTLLVIVIIALALVLAKNIIAKAAIENGVRLITGLQLKMDKFDFSLRKTVVDIENLQLFNPSGFPDKVMVDLPKILVDVKLSDLIKGKVHLQDVNIHLKEFTVVKDKNGVLNLDSLNVVKAQKKGEKPAAPAKPGKAPAIQIDNLTLKIGKVFYKDYSGQGAPVVKEFDVNLDESYKDIADPAQLVSLIVVKALMNTSIASLTNLDLGSLQGTVTNVLSTSTQVVNQAAGQAQATVTSAAAQAAVAADKASAKLKENIAGLPGADSVAGSVDGATNALKDKTSDLAGAFKSKVKLPFGKSE